MRSQEILPKGWAISRLEEVTAPIGIAGKKVKTKDAQPNGSFPVIDQGAQAQAGYLSDPAFLITASPSAPVVLFGDHTRIIKYITRDFIPGADGVKLMRAQSGVSPKYLQYVLKAIDIPSRGYGRHYQLLKSAELPLAPEPEQRRIAEKLDTVLAQVDSVNARLARITPLLKRFRQSVLAAATSGRLTGDWRDSESSFPVYELKPLGQISDARLGKMLDKQRNTGVEHPYLGNINVRWFDFDLSDLRTIKIENHEVLGLKISDGDVLVCEGGEPGRCAVWQGGDTDIVFQKAIHRVRPNPRVLNSFWLAYCLRYLAGTRELDNYFTGTTIKHLTGVALSKVSIPVPSITEQVEIIRRIEILFDFANRLEARLQAAQTSVARLTPSLLAKAFRGELVPQDPADESAVELLKRLAEARPASKVAKKRLGGAVTQVSPV